MWEVYNLQLRIKLIMIVWWEMMRKSEPNIVIVKIEECPASQTSMVMEATQAHFLLKNACWCAELPQI